MGELRGRGGAGRLGDKVREDFPFSFHPQLNFLGNIQYLHWIDSQAPLPFNTQSQLEPGSILFYRLMF